MYKNFTALICGKHFCYSLKLLIVMKLSIVLLMVTFLQVNASSFAQKVSLKVENATVKDVFQLLTEQTGYTFMADASLLKSVKPINLSLTRVEIRTVLDQCFIDELIDIVFNESYKAIIIKKRKANNLEVAQQLSISGRVTDEKNLPLAGVTIRVKGETAAVASDASGNYKIVVSNKNGLLTYKFIGFEDQEIAIAGKTTINVVLKAKIAGLDEIVVVGYGTQKRLSVSAAISSVKAADIENQQTANALSAIEGLMPGVEVKQGDGAPGSNPVIRIRGTGSLGGSAASNAPLYVVDGIPLEDASGINSINTNDIESIDVLKDAASSAIYGARGGNGVVLITTKKGKIGVPSIDFSLSNGFQNVPKKISMLDRDQHIQFVKEVTEANWLSVGGSLDVPNGSRVFASQRNPYNYVPAYDNPGSVANTDWQDEIFQKNALFGNYQVTVQGGSDKFRYFSSANYLSQNGIVRSTRFKRYSGRINLESTISKMVKAGISFTPSNTKNNILPTSGHFSSAPGNESVTVTTALIMPSTIQARFPDGLYGMTESNPDYYNLYGYARLRSPIQAMYEPAYRNTVENNRYMGTGFVEVAPLAGLLFRTSFGIDSRNVQNSYYHPSTLSSESNGVLTPGFPGTNSGNIIATESQNNFRTMNWDNLLTYKRTFNKNHDLSLLAGYSVQMYRAESVSVSGTRGTFINDLVPSPAGASTTTGGYDASEYTLISFFGRANYSFKDRYIFSGALRNDASSRFPSENRNGWFPSVSAAWRIKQEEFLKSVKFLSDLKVRVSYGVTGNYPTNLYPYQSVLTKVNYNFNNNLAGGSAPNRILNDRLTWETNKQINLGLDAGLYAGRVNFTIDYYKRNTTNLLYTVPIPGIAGFTNSFGNIGEIQNRGLELSISSVNIDKSGFKWSSNFNIGGNRNKIIHIGVNDADIIMNGDPPLTTILRAGYPLAMFYGYKTAGIFMNKADVDANPTMKFNASSGPGDTKFVDVDGDGKITSADRTLLARPTPDFTYGLINKFTYKGFDLSVQLQGVQGGKILFLLERFVGTNDKSYNQLTYSVLNRWQSEEKPGNGLIPRAPIQSKGTSIGLPESSLDRWLYDGSYLRLRNVTFGYNLSKTICQKIRLKSVRGYISAQNIYTFSNYIGYGPDANYTGEQATIQSVDYGNYPQARTVTFGLNVGL